MTIKFLAAVVLGLVTVAAPARADDTEQKVKRLAAQLTSPNSVVRLKAAQALGAMGKSAKGAVPALSKRLADGRVGSLGLSVSPVDASRVAALVALVKIDPTAVEPALRNAAANAPHRFTQAWAARQLAAIQKAKANMRR